MSNKPHLRFINPQEGLVKYIGRPGGGGPNNDEDEDKYYIPMAEAFAESRDSFFTNQKLRHTNRTVEVPQHFDTIIINFQGYFDQPSFEVYYYNNFGLALLRLENLNRSGYFAISDIQKFNHFIAQIERFINVNLNEENIEFDNKILYIRDFSFFGTNLMKRNLDNYNIVQLILQTNNLIESSIISPQVNALMTYLQQNQIKNSRSDDLLELYNIRDDSLTDLLDNFDIIYSACSNSGVVVSPSQFNVPERSWGFTVSITSEDLPIVGIIDTGIQSGTPLDNLIIDGGNEYDLTGEGLLSDNVDHGTSIACLTALGKEPIPGYRGEFEAVCRLFPIKILSENSGFISPFEICALIRKAHLEYEIRIFTLTIGYQSSPLSDNQENSSYARMLDELAYELDILIFICTTNNTDELDNDSVYPDLFEKEISNIATPAESLNNMSVGAISDNFENITNRTTCITPLPECPGSYTRKFHYNWDDSEIFNLTNRNSMLRKPDILIPGGEFQINYTPLPSINPSGTFGLEVLNNELSNGRTSKNLGTSLSVGLGANIAAKILKEYPKINSQTVKCLLINASQIPPLGNLFDGFSNYFKNRVFGYGIVNEAIALNSEDNRVTLLLEDEIEIGYTKSYPINIPKYLNSVTRKNGLLSISATLTFKFQPINDNQLIYCPLHISFVIGKNLPLHVTHQEERVSDTGITRNVTVYDGINGNSSKNLKLNSGSPGWSQDFHYKAKVFSNTQKVDFNISRDHLLNEKNQFKIAIGCEFHKLLPEHKKNIYEGSHEFSLAITIEQHPKKNEVYNSLYNEIQLVNELQSIIDLEADLEV